MRNNYELAGHRLTHEWIVCLELAFESIVAGSLGISSVITTLDGTIISQGRNQLFDVHASVNILKMNPVAHAEINALANLPLKYQQNKSLRLFTTVEPCPMCLGAIAMSRIRHVTVRSRDNWASVTDLLTTHPYLKKKNIKVDFPEARQLEVLFLTLHAYSILQNSHIEQTHQIFQTWRAVSGTAIDMAIDLISDKQFTNLIETGDTDQAIAYIFAMIQKTR